MPRRARWAVTSPRARRFSASARISRSRSAGSRWAIPLGRRRATRGTTSCRRSAPSYDLSVQDLHLAERERVEAGRPVGAGGALLALGLEQAEREQLLAEVAFVERALEDRLVQRLELREGELLGEQLEPDGRVPDLRAQPL